MNTRQRWLTLALLVTVAAAFWPGHEDNDSVVEPIQKRDKSAPDASMVVVQTSKQSTHKPGERLANMKVNLFPRQSWVPPPKPYIAPPPPPPAPPPFPFKYLGRWEEAGKQTLFLAQGDQPIPVQLGQVLFGSWRVDEITERTIVFTYLPLNMQSTLGITP
jgi:hypothetical protein